MARRSPPPPPTDSPCGRWGCGGSRLPGVAARGHRTGRPRGSQGASQLPVSAVEGKAVGSFPGTPRRCGRARLRCPRPGLAPGPGAATCFFPKKKKKNIRLSPFRAAARVTFWEIIERTSPGGGSRPGHFWSGPGGRESPSIHPTLTGHPFRQAPGTPRGARSRRAALPATRLPLTARETPPWFPHGNSLSRYDCA